jgi:hypothetical protein
MCCFRPHLQVARGERLLPNRRYTLGSAPRSRDRTALLSFRASIPAPKHQSEVRSPVQEAAPPAHEHHVIEYSKRSRLRNGATLSVPISLLWRLRRLRQCTGSTACLISTATHSQSRDIPTNDSQPCVPQDTDCGALFRLRVCLWFCHQTLTAALAQHSYASAGQKICRCVVDDCSRAGSTGQQSPGTLAPPLRSPGCDGG